MDRELVLAHLWLPGAVCVKVTGRADEDLIQTGMVALCQAANAYDPSRGARFSSFAWRRVWAAILDQFPERRSWRPQLVRLLDVDVPVGSFEDEVCSRLDLTVRWGQLTVRQRAMALEMFDERVAGGTFASLANTLGVNEDTVRWRLAPIRTHLRKVA